MPEGYNKPYLDSSVFLALVKKEETQQEGELARWQIAEHIFGDAEAGHFTIYTSTITITEVRRIRRQDQPLDADELKQVQEFFQHQYIQTIDVTREIAEMAQELGASYGITAMDAIHLATAIWWECDALLVWDKRFSRHFENGPIHGVTVSEPNWEGQLRGL